MKLDEWESIVNIEGAKKSPTKTTKFTIFQIIVPFHAFFYQFNRSMLHHKNCGRNKNEFQLQSTFCDGVLLSVNFLHADNL